MDAERIEKVKEKVFQNSLQTCEYIDGYVNTKSVLTVKCLIHDFVFTTKYENIRRDDRAHHICQKCKQEDINNKSTKIECECAYCHIKFFKYPSKINSKSGLHFCCREHKDLAQRIESGIEFNSLRPNHYNTGIYSYRDKAFREYPHECSVCRWSEDPDVLEVHHKDENRENNNIDNLIILCPLCHKKLTTHKYILVDNKITKI